MLSRLELRAALSAANIKISRGEELKLAKSFDSIERAVASVADKAEEPEFDIRQHVFDCMRRLEIEVKSISEDLAGERDVILASAGFGALDDHEIERLEIKKAQAIRKLRLCEKWAHHYTCKYGPAYGPLHKGWALG